MQNWFEVKTKFIKIDDDGCERKATEIYLVDAVSVTNAEARTIKELSQIVRGEMQVVKASSSNIVEIFPNETGEWWWKAKISIVTIDEKAGKERKINNYFLVAADDAKQALQRLEEGLAYILVPYQITSISISQIIDVFPYFGEQGAAIPANLKPIVKNEELEEVYNSDDEVEETED